MKYLIAITTIMSLNGCVSYDGLKPVYKAGKIIVKEIPVDYETAEKLRKIDKVASTYDEARGVFIVEYKAGKSDANTSEVLEK